MWKGTSTHDQQSRETEGTIKDREPSHNQVYETEGDRLERRTES